MNEHAPVPIAADHALAADEAAGDGVAVAAAIAAALPRLALGGDQLDVWNALVATQGTVVTIGALQLIYEQVPADRDRSFRQRLAWRDGRGDHAALLALEEFSFLETHGAELTMDALDQMPAAMAAVLERSALDVIAERLQKLGLRGRQVETAEAAADDGSIEVKVRIGGLFESVVGLRLKATPAALATLADTETLLALKASPEIAGQIGVAARIELRAVILPAADVAGLETGDVLLLAERTDDAAVTIVAAGRRIMAGDHEGLWMIRETGMADEETQMDSAEADLAEIGEADQLPVRVHVELASLDLPLAAIGAWAPGALVDIGLGPLSNGLPVTLRVGGRKLASGNLITLDDRFAVRLSAVTITPPKS
jgi:flagellar motor switch/type III secretory pathway protein FliN